MAGPLRSPHPERQGSTAPVAGAPTGGTWAVAVPGEAAAAWAVAAGLRLYPGIEAAPAGGDRRSGGLPEVALWLRGEGGGAELAADLRRLGLCALARRDGRAWHAQAPVPVAVLPEHGWRSLRAATLPGLPAAALAAALPAARSLRLVAAESLPAEPEPAALLLPIAEFAAWAAEAPAHRLNALGFARAGDGQALVLGSPLPPLPGRRLWRHGALLLPCGMEVDPPIPVAATAAVFGLGPGTGTSDGDGDLAVVLEASWHRLPAAAVVPARRTAVRLAAAVARAAVPGSCPAPAAGPGQR